jgi:hypothetical protein
MRYAMYGMLCAGFVGLLSTAAIGLGWVPTEHRVALHWQTAIWTVLLLLSAHTVVMFYFLATGKQLRVLMQESGREVNTQYLMEMRLFKARVFPPLMLAIGATIATFVVGGGALVGSVPIWVHSGLGFLALASNAVAGYREIRCIRRNSHLIRRIESEYLT